MAQLAYETWKKRRVEEQNETQRQPDQPQYEHIQRNVFSCREHVKQNEEDVTICICRYDPSNLDSACGGQCLNVLANTECTHGRCPCDNHCMNQKFQKLEYAKVKLSQTEEGGWGLLSDEDIKAGRFVIEYCGEVISLNEVKQRVEAYEAEGSKEIYIIALDVQEFIDATRKGSLARFINHSCEPNCEFRKLTVLGEVRVGIFAKQAIPRGTELSCDLNFVDAVLDSKGNSDSYSDVDSSLSYYDTDESVLENLSADDATTGEHNAKEKLSATEIVERLRSKKAREEVLACEASMNKAELKFDSINQEITEHERDGQNVPTEVARSLFDAHCSKMETEFDFFSSIVKNIFINVKKPKDDAMSSGNAGDGVESSQNDK